MTETQTVREGEKRSVSLDESQRGFSVRKRMEISDLKTYDKRNNPRKRV